MPYIEHDRRKNVDWHIDTILSYIETAGELNYVMTRLAKNYVDGRVSYATLNEIIGVLECVKQEFYRRVVAAYEDKKCRENGDVF